MNLCTQTQYKRARNSPNHSPHFIKFSNKRKEPWASPKHRGHITHIEEEIWECKTKAKPQYEEKKR